MEEDKQKMCPMVAGENFYFSCRKGNCAFWDADFARCSIVTIAVEMREINYTLLDWATRSRR